MRCFNVRRLFLLLAILVTNTLLNPASAEPQVTPKEPAKLPQAQRRSATPPPKYWLPIPPAIGRAEILTYASILKLDDNQMAVLLVLYDEYREKDVQQRKELIPPLSDRSTVLLADREALGEIPHAEEYAALIQECRRTATALAKLDDALFGELESVLLGEDQLPLLDRVRRMRDRTRWNHFPSIYPLGRIDLTLLLSGLDGLDELSESVQEELDELMAEYDRQITALSQQRYKAAVKSNVGVPILKAPFKSVPVETDSESLEILAAQYEEVLKKVARLNRAYIRPAKRIHTRNREYVATLVALLPEVAGSELQRRFREQAYRSIYPNPFDVSQLLKNALQVEGMTTEHRQIVEATAATYAERNDQACRDMERRYLDWRELIGQTNSNPRDELEAYESDMRRFDNMRQKASVNAITLLRATLFTEQFEEIALIVLEIEQRFSIAEENRERRLFRS